MTTIKTLLKMMPSPVERCARYAYGAMPRSMRYGKIYKQTAELLEKSQWWNRDRLEAYQMEKLSLLLNHAYSNVPYYRKIFDERNLKPTDIKDLQDLSLLPFLTRDLIRENLSDLVARNFPKSKLQYDTTGGSTGIPLGFYLERETGQEIEMAFIHALWRRVGFETGDRAAVLRGNVVRDAERGRYWERDPVSGNLILSSYHLTDENLPSYIAKIREFNPDYIMCYPSAGTIMARYMLSREIEPPSGLKALLCGSENIYNWQRDLLGKAFKCRVFSWYGHAEKTVLAGECEKSHLYHVFSEYGVLEIVDGENNVIKNSDRPGEMVATGLNNWAMPLIRYKTMDVGAYSAEKCDCGRSYQLLDRIDGRLQEMILSGDDRLISMTSINMHNSLFDYVRQFQFYQERKGEIILKIIKGDGYRDDDTARIRRELEIKLGRHMHLEIIFVEEIPRTSSGKLRFLIQKLQVGKYE